MVHVGVAAVLSSQHGRFTMLFLKRMGEPPMLRKTGRCTNEMRITAED
jgi:hypothetical protein